jgi:chromodomain-helicase-DNA-binding protein 7
VWRDVLREYEWYYEDRPHTADYLKFDVLVTTYDTLIGDFDVISQIPFRVSVVDEAHRLRNQKGKLLECMKEISAKGTLQYGYQSRVLMSGTPLQNDLNVSAEICLRVFQLSRPQYLTCSAAIRNFRNCGHS